MYMHECVWLVKVLKETSSTVKEVKKYSDPKIIRFRKNERRKIKFYFTHKIPSYSITLQK